LPQNLSTGKALVAAGKLRHDLDVGEPGALYRH
jgi:hypothetical protein